MRKLIVLIVAFAIMTGCKLDIYQIKDGKRNEKFIPEVFNNNNGHLFWCDQKDEKGRNLKNDTKQNIIFDYDKDTIIFVHGWQGVGFLGWLNHSIVNGPGVIFAPISGLISFMYNLPNNGASFPDFKKKQQTHNVASFDWQNYNNTAKEHENSEDLLYLEENLKKPPFTWPSIPKNLTDEIELLVNNTKYKGTIYIVAHSIGNQVVIRSYSMLSDKAKERVKNVVLLDPFTTVHYQYMSTRVKGDHTWLTGLTSSWIKEDLTSLLQSSGIIEKTIVIPSSDIGVSWVENFAKPLNITVINEYKKEIPVDFSYAGTTKKLHNNVLDWFFLDERYDGRMGF